jgi:hypothetical protein
MMHVQSGRWERRAAAEKRRLAMLEEALEKMTSFAVTAACRRWGMRRRRLTAFAPTAARLKSRPWFMSHSPIVMPILPSLVATRMLPCTRWALETGCDVNIVNIRGKDVTYEEG